MKDNSVIGIENPEGKFNNCLTEVLLKGCVRILKGAFEVVIETFIEYIHLRDDQGRQRIICNGYLGE